MKNEMIKAIIAEIDMDVISVRYTKDTIWALSLFVLQSRRNRKAPSLNCNVTNGIKRKITVRQMWSALILNCLSHKCLYPLRIYLSGFGYCLSISFRWFIYKNIDFLFSWEILNVVLIQKPVNSIYRLLYGGRRGIRTPGTLTSTTV